MVNFCLFSEKTATVQMKICVRAGGDSPMQYSRNWQKIKFNIFLQKKVQIMPKRKTHKDWMMLLCGVCLRKEKGLVNINNDEAIMF